MKPTAKYRYFNVSAGTLAVLLISACGGGGGSSLDVADGGIRGTGASVGPVSGFGSVFVNGIRFETDGTVTSDDGITREDQLDEGMILRIDGQWRADGEGTAEQVEYDDTFRGEVVIVSETFDPDDSSIRESVTFTIYGQTIVADKQTVFKGVSLQSLDNGGFVRVSGWRLPDGTYRASYVGEISQSTGDVEIEGGVDNGTVDIAFNRFRVNGFLIQYDDFSTEFGDGISQSDLQTLGIRLEIEGSVDQVAEEPAIFASTIERDETRRYQRGDDDDIEFVGPVSTAFDSSTRTFTINGLTVVVPDDDVFEDGLTGADLQPGLLIQVEGSFLADGRVEAEEIEIRDANSEVEGRISQASIDFSARTFLVGGVLVQVTPLTIITDDDDDQRIDLTDLNGAFEVEVEGIERSTEGGEVFLEATKVEREDDDDLDNGFEVTGRLGAIDDTTITVLGVRIRAVEGETEFDGVQRNQLMADFDSGERPMIEVEYAEEPANSGNFVAEEVELEEEDSDSDG